MLPDGGKDSRHPRRRARSFPGNFRTCFRSAPYRWMGCPLTVRHFPWETRPLSLNRFHRWTRSATVLCDRLIAGSYGYVQILLCPKALQDSPRETCIALLPSLGWGCLLLFCNRIQKVVPSRWHTSISRKKSRKTNDLY